MTFGRGGQGSVVGATVVDILWKAKAKMERQWWHGNNTLVNLRTIKKAAESEECNILRPLLQVGDVVKLNSFTS